MQATAPTFNALAVWHILVGIAVHLAVVGPIAAVVVRFLARRFSGIDLPFKRSYILAESSLLISILLLFGIIAIVPHLAPAFLWRLVVMPCAVTVSVGPGAYLYGKHIISNEGICIGYIRGAAISLLLHILITLLGGATLICLFFTILQSAFGSW